MPFLSTFAGGAVRPYRAIRIGSGSLTVNYLVVSGGGGGGSPVGAPLYTQGPGPGGGGGVLQATSIVLSRMAYVVIGAGGAGGITGNSAEYFGKNGNPSSIYNGYGLFVQSVGGGGSRANGGSGGGSYSLLEAGIATVGQGNNGATGTCNIYGCSAGGGGGGGGAGIAATQTSGGGGGAGYTWTNGDSRVVAGGGGGWWFTSSADFTSGAGGTGGGGRGAGSVPSTTPPLPGTANTGGGGGNGLDNVGNGQSGGSGVVVIRYTSATVLARGGVITQSGGFVYHTFNSSGIFSIIA